MIEFIKHINFFEWLKFYNANGTLSEKPIYSLDIKSIFSTPLNQSFENVLINSIGKSDIPFIASAYTSSPLSQLKCSGNGIDIEYSARIYHDISLLTDFSIIFEGENLDIPYYTPNKGYNFINSGNTDCEVFESNISGYFFYLPQRGISNPEIYPNSFNFIPYTDSNDRIVTQDIDFDHYLDNFKICIGAKGNKIYMYFNDELICSQDYDIKLNTINIGVNRTSGRDYYTPHMNIKRFDIYDKFILPLPEV